MRFGIREIIFVILLMAVPVGAYFFVFQPRNQLIAEARQEISAKQQKLEALEKTTMTMADLGVEIDRLTETIEMFEQKLPPQREVEVVLREVWELAARQRLTPKKIQTDKPVVANGYSELPIKMTIVGDFDGFYQFMLDLEKISRITRMPILKLQKPRNSESRGEMEAEMTLSIFFEGQPDEGDVKGGGSA